MVSQNDKATIKCICAVLRSHIISSANTAAEHMEAFEVFRDVQIVDHHSTDESKCGGAGRLVPSQKNIEDFFWSVFQKAQMSSECIIMTLIYCERLFLPTTGSLAIRSDNWKSILFSCMILASKVWDDLSMWNVDFSLVCPSYTLAHINRLETSLLEILSYDMRVPASEYAEYYFNLRSMMTVMGLQDSDTSMEPLDLKRAKKMNLSTVKFHSTVSVRKNVSCLNLGSFLSDSSYTGSGTSEDFNLSDGNIGTCAILRDKSHSLPRVNLEQLMHDFHLDADGETHTSSSAYTTQRSGGVSTRTPGFQVGMNISTSKKMQLTGGRNTRLNMMVRASEPIIPEEIYTSKARK